MPGTINVFLADLAGTEDIIGMHALWRIESIFNQMCKMKVCPFAHAQIIFNPLQAAVGPSDLLAYWVRDKTRFNSVIAMKGLTPGVNTGGNTVMVSGGMVAEVYTEQIEQSPGTKGDRGDG